MNFPMARPYATLYLLAIANSVLSVTVCEIFAVEVCMTLTPTSGMGQYKNVIMLVEWSHATSYVLAIAMFVLFVTSCEIVTYTLSFVLSSNF